MEVTKDRILGHRRAARDVALAVGAIIHNLPVAGQDRDDAGDLFLVDRALHHFVQTLQARRREPDGLRLVQREVDGSGTLDEWLLAQGLNYAQTYDQG